MEVVSLLRTVRLRYTAALIVACSLMIAPACGVNRMNTLEQPEQHARRMESGRPPSETGAVGNSNFHTLGEGKATNKGQMLAGGSEAANRVLKPMNNYVLQRNHPNGFVLRGSLQSNHIALTFDDGPDARFTPQVLDVLKKHGVKATFFVMGSRVAGHPDVTARIHDEGHALGNHTYWHPKLFQESIERLRWEVKETDKEIHAITGEYPKLFRAPYGGLNEEIVKDLEASDYTIVGWSVDSLDWTQADADTVRKNVLGNMHPGAIILMHSGGHWTQDLSGMVAALDTLIPELKAEGLKFMTIPEMFAIPSHK